MYRCCAKLTAEAVDYRTSTGVGHKFIHPISENYEHLQRPLRPEVLARDLKAFEETYVTTTGKEHDWKIGEQKNWQRPLHNRNTSFIRDVKEKNLMHPPWPVGVGACGISEYKENYPRKFVTEPITKLTAVEPAYICKVRGLGRDEQPPIDITSDGLHKHLDPYVSVTQMTHIPFTREQQLGVAKKDIDTFYDIIELPKAKGFGPKKTNFMAPMLSIRKDPVYDVATFPLPAKHRLVRTLVQRVPYVGMESEQQAKYKMPVDDFSSQRWACGVEYGQPFPKPSPWETLSAPAMYCTEYCHVGSKNFPVRAVVDPYKNTKTVKNVMCCGYHPADCRRNSKRSEGERSGDVGGSPRNGGNGKNDIYCACHPVDHYESSASALPASVSPVFSNVLCACPSPQQPIAVN